MHLLKHTFGVVITVILLATTASAQLGKPLANFKRKYGASIELKPEAGAPALKKGWETAGFRKNGFEIHVVFVNKKAEKAILYKIAKDKDGKPKVMTNGEIKMRLNELGAGKPWPTFNTKHGGMIYAGTKDFELSAQYIIARRLLIVERHAFTKDLNRKDSSAMDFALVFPPLIEDMKKIKAMLAKDPQLKAMFEKMNPQPVQAPRQPQGVTDLNNAKASAKAHYTKLVALKGKKAAMTETINFLKKAEGVKSVVSSGPEKIRLFSKKGNFSVEMEF